MVFKNGKIAPLESNGVTMNGHGRHFKGCHNERS